MQLMRRDMRGEDTAVIARRCRAFCFAAVGAMVVAVIGLAAPQPAAASIDISRKTGHTCGVCHVPAQEPRLNPTGLEYKECGFTFCKGPPSTNARPAPQPAPQPRPAARDDNAPEEVTRLGHNGSTIEMIKKGHQVTMRYSGVRPGLSAQEGAVLFRGIVSDNNTLQGTAYTFKRGCAPAGYAVTGRQTNAKIYLHGEAPVRDRAGCDIVGYDGNGPSGQLEFDIAE
jgi:hypothetical protein